MSPGTLIVTRSLSSPLRTVHSSVSVIRGNGGAARHTRNYKESLETSADSGQWTEKMVPERRETRRQETIPGSSGHCLLLDTRHSALFTSQMIQEAEARKC